MSDVEREERLKKLEKANELTQKEVERLKQQVEQLESDKKELQEMVTRLAKSTRCQQTVHECFLIALVVMATVTLAYAFSSSYHQTAQSVPNYPLNSNLSTLVRPWDRRASELLASLDWSHLNELMNTANAKLGQSYRHLYSFFFSQDDPNYSSKSA